MTEQDWEEEMNQHIAEIDKKARKAIIKERALKILGIIADTIFYIIVLIIVITGCMLIAGSLTTDIFNQSELTGLILLLGGYVIIDLRSRRWK